MSKVVLIRQALGAGTRSFSSRVDLNFVPSKVIVSQICYKAAVAETAVYGLYTDLTSSYIGTFIDGTSMSPALEIDLSNFSNNTYNFYVHEAINTLTATAAGVLSFVLEFKL